MIQAAPRKRDAAATRQRLLAAAEAIFVAKGFDAARVDEIAAQARVNKGMIYVYFKDKDGLYAQILRTSLERALGDSSLVLPDIQEPRAQTETIVRQYFRFCTDNPGFIRLMAWDALCGSQRVGQILAELSSVGLKNLREALRKGIAAGCFRKDLDVRKFVFDVHLLCSGYVGRREMLEQLWKLDLSEPEAREQVLDHIVCVIFSGIRVRDPDPVVVSFPKNNARPPPLAHPAKERSPS